MNVDQQRMATVFNEWARRYAENPSAFSSVLDEQGRPVADYGQSCAIYYLRIVEDLKEKGVFPKEPVIPQPSGFPSAAL